ncbi:MAG: hypothetical protein QXQ81_03695 [Candidatus Thorarchaeota archaeon]
MDRHNYHRMLFLIAALWNWILAILFLSLPRISMDYFYLAGPIIPARENMIWFDAFMGLVFAFGLGFFIVSRNEKEKHGLIMIASFEKTWVFVVGLLYFLFMQATPTLLLVVTGDLIFGILFLEDLTAIRRIR